MDGDSSGDQILIGVDIATCLKYFIVLHHAPQPRAEAYLYFIITFVTGASVEKLCRDNSTLNSAGSIEDRNLCKCRHKMRKNDTNRQYMIHARC